MKKASIYIFLFFYLYFVFPKSFLNDYIISFFMLCVIVLMDMNAFSKSVKMLKYKTISFFMIGVLLSSIYYLIIYLFFLQDAFSFENTRIVQNLRSIIIVIQAVAVTGILNKCGIDFDKSKVIIFRLAAFQGIICLIMLVFPSLKSFANQLFVTNTRYEDGSYILLVRIFGLTSDYTYGMPIVQGIISSLCFYYALSENIRYFIYMPFILSAAVLNSRTGILIAIIGIIIVAFYSIYVYKRISIKKMVLSILIFLIICLILCFNEHVAQFMSILFTEIFNFFSSNQLTGTSEYLLNSHLFFPNGVGLLFGEGHRVFGSEGLQYGYISSDIGYVNDMFMGGLIYCLILYWSYFRIILYNTNQDKKITNIIIAISWCIANLKGQATVNYQINAFIILWFVFSNYLKRNCSHETNQ